MKFPNLIYNSLALIMSILDVKETLTILVLITALVLNVVKIYNNKKQK